MRWAIFFGLLAGLASAVTGLCVKLTAPAVSAEFQLFSRYILCFLITFPLFVHSKPRGLSIEKVRTTQLSMHVLRAITNFTAVTCFYHTLRNLSIQEATILLLTMPLFVPIVSRIWLKIAIYQKLWWGIMLGIIGVVVIVKPTSESFNIFTLVGLVSGLFGAISTVSGRLLAYQESSIKIVQYFFTIALSLSGIVWLLVGHEHWNLFSPELLYILLSAAVAGFFYQYLMIKALKMAPARLIATFLYFSVIFAGISDWLFFNHAPTTSFLIGFTLIVVGSVLMVKLYPKDDLKFVK